MRLLLAFLLLTGCATLQPGEGVAIGALGADIATTLAGTSQNEAREINPLYGSGDNAVLASVAVGAVLHYLIREYLKDKPASVQQKTWRYVSMIRFTVAGWNAGQITR